jgi:FMN-dependent NADH-azoreductase
LTSRFADAWRGAHPDGDVVERDLSATALPPITDDWSATYGDPSTLTPAERAYLSRSDELIAELIAADVIVIGSPMYNLTISSGLKEWIDKVVRFGKTVASDAKGSRGPPADDRWS